MTPKGLLRLKQASTTLAELSNGSFHPVIDDAGHLLGIAHRDRLQTAYDGGEGWLTVGAVLDSEGGGLTIDENRPLTDALSSESFGKLGAVMAVDREGVLRGVLTADRVRRALQSAFGSAA